VGSTRWFRELTSASFQFLRMVSPLSWMPIAVMALGVGEAPVVFLVAYAAMWPVMLNVASGVQAIDPQWWLLAQSLGASRTERLWHVTIPAVAGHLLTGLRLAIGIVWIVLVPAEMLGVDAGLGYFILDTRDRMAYGELMATILFIGLMGFALDWLARLAHRRWASD
jgi:NitT/TauT family transport system permease protein